MKKCFYPVVIINDYGVADNIAIGTYDYTYDSYVLNDGDIYSYREIVEQFGPDAQFITFDDIRRLYNKENIHLDKYKDVTSEDLLGLLH